MKSGIIATVDNTVAMYKALNELGHIRVMVGVPEGNDSRSDGQITNATLAYIHNNGAPEANIPARPFMEPGIRSVQDRINQLLEAAFQAAMSGNWTRAEQILNAVGLTGQNAIRRMITTGDFVPLAASTLANRRRRGRTGTRPLVDKGELRNSISYVLRKV